MNRGEVLLEMKLLQMRQKDLALSKLKSGSEEMLDGCPLNV